MSTFNDKQFMAKLLAPKKQNSNIDPITKLYTLQLLGGEHDFVTSEKSIALKSAQALSNNLGLQRVHGTGIDGVASLTSHLHEHRNKKILHNVLDNALNDSHINHFDIFNDSTLSKFTPHKVILPAGLVNLN